MTRNRLASARMLSIAILSLVASTASFFLYLDTKSNLSHQVSHEISSIASSYQREVAGVVRAQEMSITMLANVIETSESVSSDKSEKKEKRRMLANLIMQNIVSSYNNIHGVILESVNGTSLQSWTRSAERIKYKELCKGGCIELSSEMQTELHDDFIITSVPINSPITKKVTFISILPIPLNMNEIDHAMDYEILYPSHGRGCIIRRCYKESEYVLEQREPYGFPLLRMKDSEHYYNAFVTSISSFDNKVEFAVVSTLSNLNFHVLLVSSIKITCTFLLSGLIHLYVVLLLKRRRIRYQHDVRISLLLKEKEYALEKERAFLELIQTVPYGVMLLSQDLNVLLMSDAMNDMLARKGAFIDKGERIKKSSFLYQLIGECQHSRHEIIRYTNRNNEDVALSFQVQRQTSLHSPITTEYDVEYIVSALDVSREFQSQQTLEQQVREKTNEINVLLEKEKEVSESKTVFLSTISHEMRTPLNGINGALELIDMSCIRSDNLKFIEMIRTSSSSLLRLVNDVLDFTKIESGKLEFVERQFDIAESLEKTVERLSITKAKGVRILYDDVDIAETTVMGDQLRFEQVISNLLSNALKFTTSGYVFISMSSNSVARRGLYEVTVKDTGIGIPAERLENIFERFSQGSADIQLNYGGTGLGLAISKRLTNLMGGDLCVESSPREGSTFTASFKLKKPQYVSTRYCKIRKIYLPLYKGTLFEVLLRQRLVRLGNEVVNSDPHEANTTFIYNTKPGRVIDVKDLPKPIVIYTDVDVVVENGEANIIRSSALSLRVVSGLMEGYSPFEVNSNTTSKLGVERNYQGRTVLIVDDNETNRVVIEGLLTNFKCKVLMACDGEEAIEVVQNSAPDLVFMDLQMPKKDGFEATKYIRHQLSMHTLPIIALTAAVMAGDREHCIDAGMNDFLTKPIEINDLTFILDKFLVERGAILSAPSQRIYSNINRQNDDATNEQENFDDLATWDEEGLKKRLQNMDILINASLQSFSKRWPEKYASLEKAYDDDDDTLRKAAHAFKGMAKEISAHRLARMLLSIEEGASKGYRDKNILHKVKGELDILINKLPV